MAESTGFWKALGESLCQVVAPTKSQGEIELRQQAREAAAGDDLSAALEKLAARDEEKVAKGMLLLQALRSGNVQQSNKPKEGENGQD